ncbi:MAG: hypothetical protein PHX08_01820 [Lachnospiraceae bacterium]|nr:hypothetical protein [Lachnospiraceae bacterium]
MKNILNTYVKDGYEIRATEKAYVLFYQQQGFKLKVDNKENQPDQIIPAVDATPSTLTGEVPPVEPEAPVEAEPAAVTEAHGEVEPAAVSETSEEAELAAVTETPKEAEPVAATEAPKEANSTADTVKKSAKKPQATKDSGK